MNLDRRHLTKEQRKEVVRALREEGHSYRAIAAVTGVSDMQTRRDAGTSTVTDVPVVAGTALAAGRDGRRYPVSTEAIEARRAVIREMREAGSTYAGIREATGQRPPAGGGNRCSWRYI